MVKIPFLRSFSDEKVKGIAAAAESKYRRCRVESRRRRSCQMTQQTREHIFLKNAKDDKNDKKVPILHITLKKDIHSL